jgi:hypothetical protein
MTGTPRAPAGSRARRGPVRELRHAVSGAAGTVWGTLGVLAWLGSMIIRRARAARAAAPAGPGHRAAGGASPS